MKILVTGAPAASAAWSPPSSPRWATASPAAGRDLAKGAALATSGVTFAPAELTNQALMRALVLQHDVVIHCGGLSSPWGKEIDFQRSNVDGTRILVEAALEGGQRLVFVSSPSIYFDFSDRIAIADNDPPAPRAGQRLRRQQAGRRGDRGARRRERPRRRRSCVRARSSAPPTPRCCRAC